MSPDSGTGIGTQGRSRLYRHSPERINPGDKEHTFTNIRKVVSGQNAETLEIVARVYCSVVTAGVFRASSICDYVFLEANAMKYNPFDPAGLTLAGGKLIRDIIEGHNLSTVCGYNYVIGYDEWKRRFDAGPLLGGY